MNISAKRLLKLALWGGAGLAARAAIRRAREISFSGKVVLITGGSRGLGLCMARQLVDEGASVAISARDEEELAQARRELQARGGDVLTIPCDITQEEDCRRMVQTVLKRFGRLDVLINNAGIIQVGPMETMEIADYEQAMKVHFWGPLYATLAALPELRRQTGARIVNISSIGGKISVPHLLPYSASKFALVGLSEGLRSELAKDGITVTTVCPHLMRTGSHVNATFKSQHEKEYAAFTLFAALPGNSVPADRAAARVLDACRYGQAEVVIGIPGQLAAAFHGLFPGACQDLFGIANRMLPKAGGIGARQKPGREIETPVSPSWATAHLEAAASRNNEN